MPIKLDWTDPNPLETGYRVYRSTSPMDPDSLPAPLASLPANTITYTDNTTVDDTEYFYRVSAHDETNPEQVSSEVSLLAQQTLVITFPTVAQERYTYSVVLGSDTFSYRATSGQTMTDVRQALADLIDANPSYSAAVVGSAVWVTGSGIVNETRPITAEAPEPDRQAFFYYDPATNTSELADTIDAYITSADSSSNVRLPTRQAPAGNWLASIAGGGPTSSRRTWYLGASAYPYRTPVSDAIPALSGNFPSENTNSTVWDADTGDTLILSTGPGSSTSLTFRERRMDTSGAVTSTAIATINGGIDFMYSPRSPVKFLGQWRAWARVNTGGPYYFIRDVGAANWTRKMASEWSVPGISSTITEVVGAAVLNSGTVLVVVLGFIAAGTSVGDRITLVVMRTTDGVNWSQVGSPMDANTAGGTVPLGYVNDPSAGSLWGFYNSSLQKIGSGVGLYWSTHIDGSGTQAIHLLRSNSDGTSWGLNRVGVDGVADFGRDIIPVVDMVSSNQNGGVLLGRIRSDTGTPSAQYRLIKSSNGVDFTTIEDSAIFVPGYADGPTDYKAIPGSTRGDMRTPLVGSGNKFLFERLLRRD